MSFNKKEFLERVLEALEIAIDEYLEDVEKDDNLNELINADSFKERLAKFNDHREACGKTRINTIHCNSVKDTIEILMQNDVDEDAVNFIVDLLNAPSVEESTGYYEVSEAKLDRIYKANAMYIKDSVRNHKAGYRLINECINSILNNKDNVIGGYIAALKIAAAKLSGMLKSIVDDKYTTYEFSDKELEDSYRKHVIPQLNKDRALNNLNDKVNPEVITFINRLLKIAEDAATAHTDVDQDDCIYVVKEHIGTLNKILRCKAGKASFVYLIAYLRGMANGTIDSPITVANKKVARIVSKFLMKENLMIESELDTSNPIEYVWYKTYKMYNMCFPAKFGED